MVHTNRIVKTCKLGIGPGDEAIRLQLLEICKSNRHNYHLERPYDDADHEDNLDNDYDELGDHL